MKKQVIPAIVMLAFSLLAVIGIGTFLSPCVHEDGSFGSCHWAGRALLGIGMADCALALMALAVGKARFGAYMSAIPVSLLGILTPGTLIDLCGMSTMRCRMLTQPAMIMLFAAAGIAALTGIALSAGGER